MNTHFFVLKRGVMAYLNNITIQIWLFHYHWTCRNVKKKMKRLIFVVDFFNRGDCLGCLNVWYTTDYHGLKLVQSLQWNILVASKTGVLRPTSPFSEMVRSCRPSHVTAALLEYPFISQWNMICKDSWIIILNLIIKYMTYVYLGIYLKLVLITM